MLIGPDDSFLLLIDLQAKLVPAVKDSERVLANAARLMTAASQLAIPMVATEHCASRIGPTVAALRDRIAEDDILQKTHFSAYAEKDCAQRFSAMERRKPVVLGTEAHVCVMQTTLALKCAGFDPYIVVDAVASRHTLDRDTALKRLQMEGVRLATTEMVIFEWLQRGDSQEFRNLLPVIKEMP